MKVPTGFSLNIKGIINMPEQSLAFVLPERKYISKKDKGKNIKEKSM